MLGTNPLASIPLADLSPPGEGVAPVEPTVFVMKSACFGVYTARSIIERAAKAILVQAADSTLEADEYADGLEALNGLMLAYEADGIRLGYRKVCDLSDVVTVPDGAIRAVVSNLALELAPMFGVSPNPALVLQAERGIRTLEHLGLGLGEMRFPTTLPRGSGNDCYTSNVVHFYDQRPKATITLACNQRVTEITTPAGAEKVSGVWEIGEARGLVADISGRIKNERERAELTLTGTFTLTAAGSIGNAVVGVAKNGQLIASQGLALSSTPVTVTITQKVTLETNEFIEIVAADLYSTINITLTDARVVLE